VPKTKTAPARYLYEIDSAVVKAGLVGVLAEKTNTFAVMLEKTVFLSSEALVESVFFRNSFEVLAACSEGGLVRSLRRLEAGRVVIRFSVAPDDYWSIRKKYERMLSGKKEFFVFKGGVFFIGRKLVNPNL
jgi:hypothetical protein